MPGLGLAWMRTGVVILSLKILVVTPLRTRGRSSRPRRTRKFIQVNTRQSFAPVMGVILPGVTSVHVTPAIIHGRPVMPLAWGCVPTPRGLVEIDD